MALQTALTKRLGLRYPVIAAPLGRGSTPQFLAALAREGAMGFVALMHMPEPEVRQTLSGYIAAVDAGDRFGVNLTLIVDQTRRLEAAIEEGCRVVSLWQGDIAPYARRAKDAGAIVFWTVSGVPSENIILKSLCSIVRSNSLFSHANSLFFCKNSLFG